MTELSHEKLLDSLFDGVYFVDLDRKITFWNKAAERITGYSREEVIGSRCSDNLLRHVDEDGRELCFECCPLVGTISSGSAREANVFLHHKHGYRVPVSIRVSPVRDDEGNIIGGVEIFSDNSTLLQILHEMERLKKEAYIDELTSVGNRRYGDMTLSTRIYELKTFGVPFGVIILDLDHFKQYNDTYGHKTGDEILVMAGRTITNILRKIDSISRWGGEEFLLIFPNIDSEVLKVVAERIRAFIEASYIMVGSKMVNMTASLGVTMAFADDTTASIVERADRLMYASKSSGRNRVTVG
ncbi:MAG TPA: sensor domain-containing diguanylate cyclase [Desulfomonilia bacterium]|nr:sensor domain-containing diguanylate cyclase [Desulfomonilia bacterium]